LSSRRDDEAVEDIATLQPRFEDGQRLVALREDESLSCANAAQIPAQVLAELSNADAVSHSAR